MDYSREQRAKRACLHAHLATAARVKYPAALQRYKFDAPLLASGSLTVCSREACLNGYKSGYKKIRIKYE